MRNKRVKKHIRLLSLLLCAVMVLGIIPVTNASAAEETLTVSQSSVQLPKNSSVTVTAACSAENVTPAYQWQIRVPGAGIWVDISGETGAAIRVTYGMVASLLSGGAATIRAKATIGSGTVYTGEVTVNITDPVAAAAPAPSSSAKTFALPRKAAAQTASADTDALAKKAEDAKAAAATALEALNQAKSELDAVNQAVSAAQQAVTTAQQAVDAAKQAIAAANTTQEASADPTGDTSSEETTTAPAKSAEELQAELKAANDSLTAAQTALAEARAKVAPAQAKVDEAQKAYDAAKAASDQAASAYSTATASTNEAESTPATYNIVINYVFENGSVAADPYTANIAAGSNFSTTVTFPTVQGYLPYVDEVQQNSYEINITGIDKDHTIYVVYKPTNVDYTVIHYQQNLNDDNYTEAARETKQGLTNSAVPEVAKKYEGFYALLYEKPAIAADGSTLVEVYYDRYYYLMNFDLDGGYGVEPIYARYGSPIDNVGTPTKPGYTFEGWTPSIPTVMPDHNTSYTASWKIGESGFTVVFWYENANDNGYSVAGTYTPADVAPGTQKKSEDYKNQSFTGRDDKHFTYNAAKAETVTVKGDGSTVLNVYFTRNTYTLTFKDGNIKIVCGKVEHEHSHEQCCTKTGWHLTCNSNKCPVGYEHEHTTGGWGTESCYKISDLTITAKYQADIHNNFPIKDGNDTIWWKVPKGTETYGNSDKQRYLGSIDIMPGENITFTKKGAESGAKIYYYVETLNGEQGETTYNERTYKQYKVIDLEYDSGTSLTYAEEFHPITGFTQGDSNPKLPVGGKVRMQKTNFLYYTRNSYNLKFYNYNAYVVDKGGSVQYEAPLSSYYFVPEYPANLEKNAYVFDGWYTTAGCYEGSKADLNTMTMPASDVILYAKWVPKIHTVEFYLDKAALDAGTKLSTHPDITVRHGSKAEPTPETPENGSYTFVGWFYMENGVEKAFDFANMPVNKDMQVYGKWSSNVLKEYTIYYKIQGTDTKIADPTIGSGLAGITKTFDAKGGTELYAAYQEGYFPVTKSHSLTIDINATEANDTNVFTFWYVQRNAVPYTVKYLNKETGEPVADEKTVSDNRKAVVTETFVPVNGMLPDAYQKRLVVSVDKDGNPDTEHNVIIFYYTEDTTHAYYKITHYTENTATDADGKPTWTEYASSQAVGDIGTTYRADPMTIPGFNYDSTVAGTVTSGELTADGLELKLYYTRNSYPYQVRYLEQGTGKQLASPKNETGKYGQVISESAIDITNYDKVDPISQTLNIKIEESQTEAKLNIITFYYKETEATIKYQVVGPEGCGAVTPTSETLKVLSGTAQGSTATAASADFRFVGWYTDAACTQAVSPDWVDANNKLTPVKDSNAVWTNVTYYAKFEMNYTTLTIRKAVEGSYDSNDVFIFDVVDSDGARFSITLKAGESKVITKVKVGATYTVTERTGWSSRYQAENATITIDKLDADGTKNVFAFKNTLNKSKWLTASDTVTNKFNAIEKAD